MGLISPSAKSEAGKPQPSDAQPRDFVLEIGSEELPPDDVASACEQLRERVPALLQKLRLWHGEVRVEGTPRRLAVVVRGLAGAQTSEESKASTAGACCTRIYKHTQWIGLFIRVDLASIVLTCVCLLLLAQKIRSYAAWL